MSRANQLFRSPIYGNGAYFSPPATATATAKPKVVPIPVQFVRSDGDKKAADRAAAAVKIQKAFRGFVVRKNAKIVRKIDAEIDEIELRFRADQGMDRIVRDEKERLTISEMLMRLLFRLDSVRGVREYRKRAIRRVIALQEMVDSISAAESNDQTPDMAMDQAAVAEVETSETGDQVVEIEKKESGEEAREELSADAVTDAVTEESKTLESTEHMEISHQEDDERDALVEEAEAAGTGAEEVENSGSGDHISKGWELLDDKALNSDQSAKNPESDMARVSGGMKEVMERMVAENEKLKGLVAELCERSAQECMLMGGLAGRVEYLEKMVEKMERRKKKRKEGSTSPASSIDKKCGRDKQLH